MTARVHAYWNRFNAEIDADDLDTELTAPREGVGISERSEMMIDVLTEVFNEARSRAEKKQEEKNKSNDNKREEERNYVDPRNVERPVADVLSFEDEEDDGEGSDADDTWIYLDPPAPEQREDVIDRLYTTEERTQPYDYDLVHVGEGERMVRFNPADSRFSINADHPLVMAYYDDARAKHLLYDVVTAEALLEVYLREAGLPAHLAEKSSNAAMSCGETWHAIKWFLLAP